MADYCGTGSGNFPQPGDPDLNNSSINAVPAFGGIDVSWSYPELNPEAVAHTILYRSTNEDPATRVRHRIVQGDYFYDRINNESPITYYYWVQHVSVNGTIGDLIGPDSAQARPTIEQTIEMLTGQIDNGVLATELKGEIGRLDSLESDLLAEKTNRINSDDTISAAFSDLEVNVANVETLVQSEITERQTADANQVDSINTLFAQMDDNNALILEEQVTRAEKDEALASDIETLQTQTGNNSSAITDEATTRANEDSALGSRIDSVVASSVHVFRGATEPDPANTTINANDLWVDTGNGNRLYQWDGSQWLDSQDTDIAGAFAAINTEETARIEADNAQASRMDTIESNVSDNSGAIQTEQNTRATEDQALAEQINTAQTNLGNDIASVETTLNTEIENVNEEVTNIGAQYTAKVDVNGLVGGFGVYNDGTQVEAGFDVDRFWVGRTGDDKRKPFIVEGGEVFIDEAAINKLQFNKLRADDSSVVVENGKLKANYIDAQNLYLDYGNIQNVDIQWADINNVSIGSADIANGSITSAKIGNAEVDTLQIKNQAVTIQQSVYRSGNKDIKEIAGGYDSYGTPQAAISVTTESSGAPIDIVGYIKIHGGFPGFNEPRFQYRILVNGSAVKGWKDLYFNNWDVNTYDAGFSYVNGNSFDTVMYSTNTSEGEKTIAIQVRLKKSNNHDAGSNDLLYAGPCYLRVLETKR